jgi:hypothetical protein
MIDVEREIPDLFGWLERRWCCRELEGSPAVPAGYARHNRRRMESVYDGYMLSWRHGDAWYEWWAGAHGLALSGGVLLKRGGAVVRRWCNWVS